MVLAPVAIAAAALSGAAAVGFAVWVITQPQVTTLVLPSAPFTPRLFVAACGLVGLVWAITGAALAWLRPRNALGWLMLAVGVSQAWAVGLTAYGWLRLLEAVPSRAAYIGPALFIPGWLIPATLLLALYPEGRLPGPLWRWPVTAATVAILLLTACVPFPVVGPERTYGWVMVPALPERLADVLMPSKPTYGIHAFILPAPAATTPVFPQWWVDWRTAAGWVFKPILAASMLTIWVGTVRRLLRARTPRRQQLAWLVCAVMPVLAASFLAPVRVANVLIVVSLLLVPLAVAVGVLRYRLLGIEAVLRRGLVYGTFTVAVVGAYVIVTVLGGSALGRWLPGVVAAALVAAVLAPARDRLQRAADRLVYGERGDPLSVLTRLGQQVAAPGQLELLPGALTSVIAAVRAPGAAVTAPDGRTIAATGTQPQPDHSVVLPLLFDGRQIGQLQVALRRPHEGYTSAEMRLLTALAPQIAVIAKASELTRALETEHGRVLVATEAERDRLRAELHDGLGPSLSGIALGLQALGDLDDQSTQSRVLLHRIRDEVDLAFAEVRRLIDGLRPSVLDTLGLVGAIRRHAETLSTALPVHVVASELPVLPPQVETAAYRIITEALTNAARHAGAKKAQVTMLVPDGSLQLTVTDDGHGVRAAAGVGLTSMRRRTETLGGHLDIHSAPSGTTITATLPLEQP
jgi:signal transduction histidine kinase